MAMSLIEGVGDEVTLFFFLSLLTVVAGMAWLTTRVADRPLRIQTIIVGQRVIHVDERGEREGPPPGPPEMQPRCEGGRDRQTGVGPPETQPRCEQGQEGRAGAGPPPGPLETQPRCEDGQEGRAGAGSPEEGEGRSAEDRTARTAETGQDAAAEDGSSSQNTASATAGENAAEHETGSDGTAAVGDSAADTVGGAVSSLPADPGPGPVSTDPSDCRQQVRRRRLALMARQSAESAAPPPPPDTANSSQTELTAADAAGGPAQTASQQGTQTITVKLKFLNDTQRLVEGRRAEPLVDFKRRHFPAETAANRMVRLIFNGRVLPDQETLSQCGLYHNCVVHCHVSSAPRPAAAAAAAAGGGAPAELDIGVLLYPVLTSVVTLVWGLRLRYPELFSGTAVLLLAVLTLLLACCAAATFLPLQRLPAPAAGGRQQQRGR